MVYVAFGTTSPSAAVPFTGRPEILIPLLLFTIAAAIVIWLPFIWTAFVSFVRSFSPVSVICVIVIAGTAFCRFAIFVALITKSFAVGLSVPTDCTVSVRSACCACVSPSCTAICGAVVSDVTVSGSFVSGAVVSTSVAGTSVSFTVSDSLCFSVSFSLVTAKR